MVVIGERLRHQSGRQGVTTRVRVPMACATFVWRQAFAPLNPTLTRTPTIKKKWTLFETCRDRNQQPRCDVTGAYRRHRAYLRGSDATEAAIVPTARTNEAARLRNRLLLHPR